MRKLFNYCLVIFTFVFLQSCYSFAETQQNIKTDDKAIPGYYVYGHEVNDFQPCSQDKVFWVNGSEQLLAKLEKQYSKLTTKPYEKIFIIITGEFTGKTNDGFAMNYDGQIRIDKVIELQKLSDTDCQKNK